MLKSGAETIPKHHKLALYKRRYKASNFKIEAKTRGVFVYGVSLAVLRAYCKNRYMPTWPKSPALEKIQRLKRRAEIFKAIEAIKLK